VISPSQPAVLNTRGARMDRHAATRRLHRLVEAAGVRIAQHAPAHAPTHHLTRQAARLNDLLRA
jgi:exonuclease III